MADAALPRGGRGGDTAEMRRQQRKAGMRAPPSVSLVCGAAYPMRERLENVHFGMNLRLLSLSDPVHIDLAPSDLDALFLIIAFVHGLEGSVPKLLIELRRRDNLGEAA